MARPDIKLLAPFQNALTAADGKYDEVLRNLVRLDDPDMREATAETLLDMLELEVKETQKRISQLRAQRWRREQAPKPASGPPPGTPPAPEHRESIWSNGTLPPIVVEDFRRLAGLSESHVGDIIVKQMGGGNRIRAMLGAKIYDKGDGVGIAWPSRQRSKGNYVEITLRPDDTYDMAFFNVSSAGRKPVKTYSGIYADALIPTFERQTGYALHL